MFGGCYEGEEYEMNLTPEDEVVLFTPIDEDIIYI